MVIAVRVPLRVRVLPWRFLFLPLLNPPVSVLPGQFDTVAIVIISLLQRASFAYLDECWLCVFKWLESDAEPPGV